MAERSSGSRGFVRLGAAVAAAILEASSPRAAGAREIALERFDAEIEVARDASVEVTERLRLRFEGSWNGIVRSLPVRSRTPYGFTHALALEVLEVTDEAHRPLRCDEEPGGRVRALRIWVPGASDAVRIVVLRYRVRNAVGFFDRWDELYWNVTGDEWEFPILSATAQIRLPEGATGVRVAAFTGPFGSVERDAEVTIDGSRVRVAARRALGFREGLTVAVAWDKGVVSEPSRSERVLSFLRANGPLGLPLLALAVMGPFWYWRGRDPRMRPIAVRYGPPADLSPAEVGTLADNSPDLRDIVATIVDLAVRGFLEIAVEERPSGLLGLATAREYTFRRRDVPPGAEAALRPHEALLRNALFQRGPAVRLSDLEHRFYRELPRLRSAIFDRLLARGHYAARPDRVRRFWLLAAAVVGGAGWVAADWVAVRFGVAPLSTILGTGLAGAVIAAFGWFMPARTLAGTRVLEEILGFEEFLERVEADRLERLPPTPETFERLLPYAMALGLEKRWAAAFEGICREPPRWYSGPRAGVFGPRGFAEDLGSMSRQVAAAMAAAPRSAGGSGFSGHGFSGGGFGGGGGRGF